MDYQIPVEDVDYKKKNSILFETFAQIEAFQKLSLNGVKAHHDYNNKILTGNFTKEDVGFAILSRGRVIDLKKYPL